MARFIVQQVGDDSVIVDTELNNKVISIYSGQKSGKHPEKIQQQAERQAEKMNASIAAAQNVARAPVEELDENEESDKKT